MAIKINIQVGRQRIYPNTGIHEAAYVRSIRVQTRLIQDNLKRVVDGVDGLTPEAIKFGLQPMFDESQILVPVDKGKLKASGFLKVRKTPTGATAAMGYGRRGKPFYTGFVHERLDLAHKAPTQAKFLEDAIKKHMNQFLPRVTQYIKRQAGFK